MSEIKIPPDSQTVNPYLSPEDPKETPQAPLRGFAKDSLEAFSKQDALFASRANNAPQLQIPQDASDSLIAYFKTINAATLSLRYQLRASELVDIETRRHRSKDVAAMGLALIDLYEKRKQAIEKLEGEARQVVDEMQKKWEEMQKQAAEQKERTDHLNAGNAEEKQQYNQLNQAYQDYLKKLKELGAVDQGDGTYLIPEGAKDQYNAITREYQQAVDGFNQYWTKRQAEIDQYNAATHAYNQNVAANNASINQLIDQYQLADFFKESGLPIPPQTVAGTRDVSGYEHPIKAPSPIATAPVTVSIPPLPPYIAALAQAGPPSLAPPQTFSSIDQQALYAHVYDRSYETQIKPLDQNIQTNQAYWSFLREQNLLPSTQSEPVLNTKPLALKILPEALLKPSHPMKTSSQTGAGAIALQAVGLGDVRLETVLGRMLLKKALEHSDLLILKQKSPQEKEPIIEELTDQLLVLSVGLLSNQSLQALFPSLNLLSSSLDKIPQDSPAFALLFAVSLANRVQEDTQQGLTAEVLENFINENPAFAGLTDEDKGKLAAMISLGQLLVASKLLESSLGLEGLLANRLPDLLPASIPVHPLVVEAMKENNQALEGLRSQLTDHFTAQGYTLDKAQFLAQFASQLVERGLETPTAPAVQSAQAIDQKLLTNSVQASLVLAHGELEESKHIAENVIRSTLAEGPYRTTNQFRTALESHLQEMGIGEKSQQIALQAVIVPPREASLAPQGPLLPPPALKALVTKETLALLVPQLGAPLAKQILEEVLHTLEPVDPGARAQADHQAVYSLENVTKKQVSSLTTEQNEEWAQAVFETFKETIKTTESFYAFSLKIMNPAYLFIYSAYAGMIYGSQGQKKPIDLLI